MRRKLLSVCSLIAYSALLFACNRERSARRYLEAEGLTDVVLTKSGGSSFTFTAKNADKQHCVGDVSVSGGSTTYNSLCSDVCTVAEPTRCFAMALKATDPAKATEYYVLGCNANDASCCVNAGLAYDKATGVTKDESLSFSYDKKACDLNDAQGCVNLAIDYEEGLGTPKDLAAAFHANDTACTKLMFQGCSAAGRALVRGLGTPPDVIAGMDRVNRACIGGYMQACTNQGTWLFEGAYGVTKDAARGQALLEQACTKDEPTACYNLGLYCEQKKIPDPSGTQTATYFTKSCEKGDGTACSELGYLIENGKNGFKLDLAYALTKYQKGCELKDGLACRNAGVFYKAGRGTTKDLAQAATDFDNGCAAGNDECCKLRKSLPN